MGQDVEGLSTESTTTPADIEATRASLSRDIDELADKVSPARVVDRRKEAAKGRLSSVRDKLIGAAPDLGTVKSHVPGVGGTGHSGHTGQSGPGLGERASDAASGAAGVASGAVDTVGARAQGNPLAAGLVAFGVGMLVSALIPASERETRLASQAVDAAQEHGAPLIEEAKSVGQDIAGDLKESATESVAEVKATAQDSVQTVKAEGQSSAETVKNDATPN